MMAVTPSSAVRFPTSNLCAGVKFKYGPLFPDSGHSNIGATLVLALSIADDGTNDLFGSGNFCPFFAASTSKLTSLINAHQPH